MSDGGLEPRVVALETQMGDLSGEMRDFRRATAASFNALRQDMTNLRHDVTDLRQDVTDLRGHVDTGFIAMRGMFDAAAVGQQQIVDLLGHLIEDQD